MVHYLGFRRIKVSLVFLPGTPFGYMQIYIVELVVVRDAVSDLLCGFFSIFICFKSEFIFGFILLLGMSMYCVIRSTLTRYRALLQLCKPFRILLLLFWSGAGFVVLAHVVLF